MPLNTRAFSTVSTEFPASPFASTVGTGGCAPDSHKFPTKECNPMRVQGADTTRPRHYIEMVFLLLFVTVAVVVTVAIYLFRWQVYFLFFLCSSPTLVFLQVSRSMVATRFLLNKLKQKSLGCRRWKKQKKNVGNVFIMKSRRFESSCAMAHDIFLLFRFYEHLRAQ